MPDPTKAPGASGGLTASQLPPQTKANGLLALVSGHAKQAANYRRRIVNFIFSNPDGLKPADAAALFGVGASAMVADAGVAAPAGCTITANADGTISVTLPAKA